MSTKIEIAPEYLAKAQRVVGAHAPSHDEDLRLTCVRDAGANLIAALMTAVPAGADRQAAIRHVREAVMTAESGICMRGTDPTRD